MNNPITIHAEFYYLDADRRPLEDRQGDPVSKKVLIMRESDKFKALLGDGQAHVSVGLDESMGGPYGYSSVKLRVTVSLRCDQNEKSVKEAGEACLNECLQFIEDHMGKSVNLLVDHLETHYRQERGQ